MSSLVLAGGGHSHALALRRWAMQPSKRPKGRICLIDQRCSALYSGMVPGVVSGIYKEKEASIDLRHLASQAGVDFIQAKIESLDWQNNNVYLSDNRSLHYEILSLNLGCNSPHPDALIYQKRCIPIKPLWGALKLIQEEVGTASNAPASPFSVVGSGLAAIEICLGLRKRWPTRCIQLVIHNRKGNRHFYPALRKANIRLITEEQLPEEGPILLCTGSVAPTFLQASGLLCNSAGRVRTEPTLQALGHRNIFASGDCAVIDKHPRPPSGVWAVRAALVLARNLQAASCKRPLQKWNPQRRALQLVGHPSSAKQGSAWALWGNLCIGPYPWIWQWKQRLDRHFIAMFKTNIKMTSAEAPSMACRGCAAKLPASTLQNGLREAGLAPLGNDPNDAVLINDSVVQSVDGFPALVSDPWLNAYLTTLHACSDLWASGAEVDNAQALITLPAVDAKLQQDLLRETLSGIRAALKEQDACLLGGHTLESRDPSNMQISLGIQVSLVVNGQRPPNQQPWSKGGLQAGDALLLSRAIGSGVLFAAAMTGQANPRDIEQALVSMQTSQHKVVQHLLHLEAMLPDAIHACTDITGFGLIGHLGEMLDASDPGLRLSLDVDAIPIYKGTLALIKKGICSTLAPSNRMAWSRLDSRAETPACIQLTSQLISNHDQTSWQAIREILVDPQTCGPLALACPKELGKELCRAGPWTRIGSVR